jgi:hypothetical protein
MTRNLFFCEECAASFSIGYKGKNFSFPIRTVNFCETFCTCSSSSLGQDLTVIKCNFLFFSFGFLELEMVALRCFLRKKTNVF